MLLISCIVVLLITGMASLAYLNHNVNKARQNLEIFGHHSLHLFNNVNTKLDNMAGFSTDFLNSDEDEDVVVTTNQTSHEDPSYF